MKYNKDNTVIIIATGQSMSQSLADAVRGWDCIVVNNAYELRHDANYLVAQDRMWWKVNGKKVNKVFRGDKYTTLKLMQDKSIKKVEKVAGMEATSNSSAVLAVFLASQLGYKRAILLGVDCYGTHFFGAHKPPLKNTKPQRFAVFQQQFKRADESLPNLKIVNCTIGTHLETIEKSTLEEQGIIPYDK